MRIDLMLRYDRRQISLLCLTAIGLALWAGLSGCFYSFRAQGKSDIKSVAVERFENETAEFGLGDRLTDILIDQFIADGNLKVVSARNADVIITGVLTGYERLPHVFDENDRVQQYKVRFRFRITLTRVSDQSELWSELMSPEGIYDANSELEEDGQRLAAEALVEAILNRTTKSW